MLRNRPDPAESLAAEVIPLVDACRFLERRAGKILATRRSSRRDRPAWLRGVSVSARREPLGTVLIIAAGNYPLLLAGVQTLQALVAGNAVLLKPAPGASRTAVQLQAALATAGLPPGLLTVLPAAPEMAQQAIEQGVDKVILTGSAETGIAVARSAAAQLTPCTMELSGCDAVFVLSDADADRAARCVAFGLGFSGSATCIAPRRVFVDRRVAAAFSSRLLALLRETPPLPVATSAAEEAERLINETVQQGGKLLAGGIRTCEVLSGMLRPVVLQVETADLPLMKADLMAPVLAIMEVEGEDDALRYNDCCPYALGASIFGGTASSTRFAERVPAGCITINDSIAPTADPRVAFGGWKRSGSGVTRGAEGLLEMTRIKAIVTRRSKILPHLLPRKSNLAALLSGYLRLAHGGGWKVRLRGLWELGRNLRGGSDRDGETVTGNAQRKEHSRRRAARTRT